MIGGDDEQTVVVAPDRAQARQKGANQLLVDAAQAGLVDQVQEPHVVRGQTQLAVENLLLDRRGGEVHPGGAARLLVVREAVALHVGRIALGCREGLVAGVEVQIGEDAATRAAQMIDERAQQVRIVGGCVLRRVVLLESLCEAVLGNQVVALHHAEGREPGALQSLRQGHQVVVQTLRSIAPLRTVDLQKRRHGQPVLVHVKAGEQRRCRRLGPVALHVGAAEDHRLRIGGEGVDVGRRRAREAVATELVGAAGVEDDDDHAGVRRQTDLGPRRRLAATRRQKGGEQNQAREQEASRRRHVSLTDRREVVRCRRCAVAARRAARRARSRRPRSGP